VVDPDLTKRVTDRTMGDNLEALRKGEIDVAQLFEPYVSMALATGAGQILYAASTRGPTVYTTFLATRESIARNRPAFTAMARAVRHMEAWLQEHSADELADAVAPFYPSVASELLVSALRRYHQAGLWATRPEVSREGFARLAISLRSGGFVSRLHSYEECVDQSLC
jgi:NitT/TauT family transport system substrate-binding protein